MQTVIQEAVVVDEATIITVDPPPATPHRTKIRTSFLPCSPKVIGIGDLKHTKGIFSQTKKIVLSFSSQREDRFWLKNVVFSFDQSSYPDYQRNEKNRHEPKLERKSCDDGSLLPQLRNSTNKPDNSASYPPFYRSRGYHSGNYYGGNKKYRGNRSQRRDQETENGNPRREYRGDQQRHHRQEYVEPADPTKDCKSSRKP